jgi:competence protein ComEC
MAQVGGAEPRSLGIAGLTAGPGVGAVPLLGALARNLEAEQERWFLWLPVMFGAGIALYFLLPVEPWTVAATLPAVAALAVHLALGRSGLAALATAALLAVALGLAAGKLRTEAMRAPVLERQMGPIDVYGFIELIEPRPTKGQRLTIRVTAMEKHEAHAWPYRVR